MKHDTFRIEYTTNNVNRARYILDTLDYITILTHLCHDI